MKRLLHGAATVAACLALVPASAAAPALARALLLAPAAPTWKVFAPGGKYSVYQGIVLGADRAVWVADETGKALFRFDPAGHAQSFPVSPFQPAQMTVGADGAFYLNSISQATIARFTPAGGIQTFAIPSGDIAFGGMALGPAGKVWFTEQSHIASVSTSGAITEYPLNNLGVAGGGVALGHDGKIWFSGVIGGAGAMISKIDPKTGSIVTYQVQPRRTCYPNALVEGPDGDVWFGCASSGNSGGIGRIAPDGRYSVNFAPNFGPGSGPGFQPQSLVLGPDKALWYAAGSSSDAIVGRFDIATAKFTRFFGPGGTVPWWGLIFDTSGNLWGACTSFQVDEVIR